MKRLLPIGLALLVVSASIGWWILRTQGVDISAFETVTEGVLKAKSISTWEHCSTEPETVTLPKLVKWNPRFWKTRPFGMRAGHGTHAGCEVYELISGPAHLQCFVKHTPDIVQYAEIRYEWRDEERAEELRAALAREFPHLLIWKKEDRLKFTPCIYSVAVRIL